MTFRKKPMSVLLLDAEFPLVESGGKRLDHLREDFYDNAVAIRNRRDATPIVSPYDIALSGGEPYSVWR